jgi:hypothetical protein
MGKEITHRRRKDQRFLFTLLENCSGLELSHVGRKNPCAGSRLHPEGGRAQNLILHSTDRGLKSV